jgi:hypothetical protein
VRILRARAERIIPFEALRPEANVLARTECKALRPGQTQLKGVGREPATLLQAGPVFLRTRDGRGFRLMTPRECLRRR